MTYEIVQFWKGTREQYARLRLRNRVRDNIRYSVIEENDTVTEYLGERKISNEINEQLAAVDTVMSSVNFKNSSENFNSKRLLIGPSTAFNSDGYLLDDYDASENDVWYIVDYNKIINGIPNIINFKGHTVRIKSYHMKEYMLVNNKLITYDDELIWKN